jgi:hypothetical protein
MLAPRDRRRPLEQGDRSRGKKGHLNAFGRVDNDTKENTKVERLRFGVNVEKGSTVCTPKRLTV